MSIKNRLQQAEQHIKHLHRGIETGCIKLQDDLSVMCTKERDATELVQPPQPGEDWRAALERQGYHPIAFIRLDWDEV